MARVIQNFHVGLKAFIERDGKILVVRETVGGLWEIPGGRIDMGEEHVDLHQILLREIHEELGQGFTITIGKVFHTWVRQWTHKAGFVYLTGYRCAYVSGNITISDEHTETRWIDQAETAMLEFAPGYREAIEKFWEK